MLPSGPWTSRPQGERDHVLASPGLRALSHPVRARLVGVLREDGPSTASRLAKVLGLNSGITSYHLRQLASAGLIVEMEERGTKRDRWWRADFRSMYFDMAAFDDDPEAAMAYLNTIATVYAEEVVQFSYQLPTLPTAWSSAATMSDFRLRLTATEAEQMLTDLSGLLAKYRRDEGLGTGRTGVAEGAELVVVQLQVMPKLAENTGI